jgi:hypothetical protein
LLSIRISRTSSADASPITRCRNDLATQIGHDVLRHHTGADGDVWFHHIVPTATAGCLRT